MCIYFTVTKSSSFQGKVIYECEKMSSNCGAEHTIVSKINMQCTELEKPQIFPGCTFILE